MAGTKEIDCNDHDGIDCTVCDGTGKRLIGAYRKACVRHCIMCEGADHHWDYFGEDDGEGEALMSCKHCTALRYMTQEEITADI